MKDKYIIIAILFLIAILFFYRKQENITSTDSGKTLSDEAVQNIASVYNTQNMIVTNLTTTSQTNMKDAKISNNLNVSGTITGNVKGDINGGMTDPTGKYRLSLEPNGTLLMFDTSVKPWKYKQIGVDLTGNFNGLFSGQLLSPDRARALVPQDDGNLVLYWTGAKGASLSRDGYGAMWATSTHA